MTILLIYPKRSRSNTARMSSKRQVLILERAVVGVSPEVRVFHNWEPVRDEAQGEWEGAR